MGSASRSAGEQGARASNPTAPAAAGRLSESRLSKLIAHSVGATGADVTFRVAEDLPDSIEVDCRCAADRYIERDGEVLAHHAGLSPRVVNHQRERSFDRKPALETVVRMLWAGRLAGWSYKRRAAFAAPIFEALGADPAPHLPVEGSIGVPSAAAELLKSLGGSVAGALEAVRDGRVTARELEPLRPAFQDFISDARLLWRELELLLEKEPPC